VIDGGALVGIVTLEDVQEKAPSERDMVTVGDVMSTDLVTVTPTSEAARR